MCQGEEISRQEKVVSSWSGSGGKSLFVCPQRSGQEAQVFASSLSGHLVSWGAGIGVWWWLSSDGSCIICHTSEARSLNCFNVLRLSASCQSSQPTLWIPFLLFCLLSAFTRAYSFLVPMSTHVKANNTSTKYNESCQTDLPCIIKCFYLSALRNMY